MLAEFRLLRCGRLKRYATDPITRMIAAERRAGLAELKLCINGKPHGKATHGVLCRACRERHRRSA